MATSPTVAIGPEMPGIGSWDWVGRDFVEQLRQQFSVTVWRDVPPPSDIVVVVKYGFDSRLVEAIGRAKLIFCPIDAYAHGAEIDRLGILLCRCARIIVHALPLMKYFRSYAAVEYLDHALRYVSALPEKQRTSGPVLAVAVRNNIPSLVAWANRNEVPGGLRLLTDCESDRANPADFGFDQSITPVTVERWTPARHITWTGQARAAMDVKGNDFRQRYKPPAKSLDFIACGLPVATNAGSVVARHLKGIGFDVPVPDDTGRWLSEAYWRETQRLAARLRSTHSREEVGQRLRSIVEAVHHERGLFM